MRPQDLLDLFEIDPARAAAAEEEKPEPAFAPQPVSAPQPIFVGFDEPEDDPEPARRLDGTRASGDESGRPLQHPGTRRAPLFGLILSLAAHLSPLMLLLTWTAAPSEPERPIPVQLVLEQPATPPPAPPLPKGEDKPPIGNIASEDIGGPAGKPDAPATEAPEPTEPPPPLPPRPRETKMAAANPPPKVEPNLTSALPKPAPTEAAFALPEPEHAPAMLDVTPPPKPKQPVTFRAPVNPRPAARPTQVPGPAATRNEYLAYCESLIRQHSGLIPESLLAGRRGSTTLSLLVLGDGSIARISILQSSGYSDIDARVEQMIAAVKRFPPLPQWFQGSSMPLMYHFAFPDRR